MPRFLLTFVSFFLFLFTLVWINRQEGVVVSQGTDVAAVREMFSVKQGLSSDGQFRIEKTLNAPVVSHRVQFSNHERNLRVFVASDRAGVPTLYLEQVKPHDFFVISGPFAISPDTASFMWNAPTSLFFYATDTDGFFARYAIDVHNLAARSEPLSEDFHAPRTPIVGDSDL